MNKVKLDKEAIIKELSSKPDVIAIKFEVPDEIEEEQEGCIKVLYDQEINTSTPFKRSLAVSKEIKELINPNGIETYIAILMVPYKEFKQYYKGDKNVRWVRDEYR